MIYTIPKGKHYSQPRRFGFHLGAIRREYKVKFTQSCLNTVVDGHYQWNKGSGFTYSLFNDNNSIRWAWRVSTENDKLIEVGLYLHSKGQEIEPIESFKADINQELTIVLINDYKRDLVTMSVDFSWFIVKEYIDPQIGYYNYPYFGGRNKSPHDVIIEVN